MFEIKFFVVIRPIPKHNYIKDKKNGVVILKFWDKVVVEGYYENDKKESDWKGFGANGKLVSWIEFHDDKIQSDETERYKKEIEEKKLAEKKEKDVMVLDQK